MEKSAFTYNEIIWTFFIISFIYLWTFFITNSLCSRLCILTQNYTNSLKLYKLYSGSLPTFGLRKKKKKTTTYNRYAESWKQSPYGVHIFCGCFVLFLSCILYKLIYFKTWRYVGRWIIHLLKKLKIIVIDTWAVGLVYVSFDVWCVYSYNFKQLFIYIFQLYFFVTIKFNTFRIIC